MEQLMKTAGISHAPAVPARRETLDPQTHIRVVSIFAGTRTASEAIHTAAVKKILYDEGHAGQSSACPVTIEA